jgi:hypothetical protein
MTYRSFIIRLRAEPLPSEARFLVWGALAAAAVIGALFGALS